MREIPKDIWEKCVGKNAADRPVTLKESIMRYYPEIVEIAKECPDWREFVTNIGESYIGGLMKDMRKDLGYSSEKARAIAMGYRMIKKGINDTYPPSQDELKAPWYDDSIGGFRDPGRAYDEGIKECIWRALSEFPED